MSFLSCAGDSAFGPAVRGCRADFDFTLKFERIVLGMIPAAILIATAIPRIVYLATKPVSITGRTLRLLKSTTITAYAAVQLAILALTATHGAGTGLQTLSIATAALTVASTAAIFAVSWLEHSRSPRPSMFLTGYLAITILCDVTQVRTLWLMSASGTHQEITIARLTTAALAIKAILTILESWHKTRWADLDHKTHSPEETAGLFGLGAFFWLNRLFSAGYKKILTLNDLFPLDYNMSATRNGQRLNIYLQDKKFHGQKHGLLKALARSLTLALSLPIAPRMALLGFTFCQPFLINSILSYLEEPTASRDRNVGYGLVGATIIVFFGMAVSNAFYWYFHERSLWMARSALASVIYEKTVEMKINEGNDAAAVTLMSTDVEKIRSGVIIIHELWSNVISSAVAGYLLYRELGVAFVAPILAVAACSGATFFVANFTGKRQKQWMEKIQVRVGMTANVIAHMKNIKISGFALPVESIIHRLRLEELRVGGGFRLIICWSVVLSYFPPFVSPVVTLAWTSKTLTVTRMFTSYSYLFLLTDPLVGLIQGVPMLMGSLASLSRIQSFLETESRQDPRKQTSLNLMGPCEGEKDTNNAQDIKTPLVHEQGLQDAAISISGGSFGWTAGTSSLSDIHVQIPTGQLTVVVGPVASGKSTFCKVLLGEVPYTLDGRVALQGNSAVLRRRIGYCDQAPFLTNGTIRQNIIGFSAFDQKRYDEVIEAAMLRSDLLVNLPQGDATKIGSNGISLSGGQKQRVSIARALYLETDFFIFDDVLSGLDADTSEQVFWRVFGPNGVTKRRKATVILCTHSIKHLPSANHIIALGADGRIVEQGTFENLVANKDYVHSLGVKAGSTMPDSSDQSEENESTSITEEQPETDKVIEESSSPVDNASRMNGDRVVYKHYYHSIGFWPLAAFVCFTTVVGFFWNWQTIWINFWSSDVSSSSPSHGNSYYLGLFGLFQFIALAFLFAEVYVCVQTMVRVSGSVLHKAALSTTIKAPLRFFTTTDNGVITNLFSQDMNLVDYDLPLAMVNTASCLLVSVGMAAVVATSAPYLAISYPFLFTVLYLIQNFYLKTSRQLRLLDLEAKSPLYTHFMDTMNGIITFRALGWTQAAVDKSIRLIDDSQRPAYLLAMIQRWLGFVLDCVIAVLAIVVVAMSTQMSSNPGFTGASLVTLMNFGPVLSNMIRSYTTLETSLGAINRLKTYSETVKSESGPHEGIIPDEAWPTKGEIRIEGVSASYNPPTTTASIEKLNSNDRTDLALRDLNLCIQSGEKVAICGRSGSGKSSTVLLLLRLLEPLAETAEQMYIDDVPLHRIDRQTLRQRIIAVPQESVFLPDGSSIKSNLDPLLLASDADCRAVLEKVGLWHPFVTERGGEQGLEAGMNVDMLSQGQKQLFSLARALLRRRARAKMGVDGGILLLDEISSSVDVVTDREMQRIIHEEFTGYTILMVSHRLDMVMEFDKVIVMERGCVVESGAPRVMAEEKDSRFRSLWLMSRNEKD